MHPIDWELWARLDVAACWQWVAVLCELNPDDPEAVRFSRDGSYMHDDVRREFETDSTRFPRLLLLACKAMEAHNLKALAYGSTGTQNPVTRGEFVRWARSIGWTVPEQLRDEGGALPPSSAVPVERRVEGWKTIAARLGTSEREARRRLESAQVNVNKEGRTVWIAHAALQKVPKR